MSRAADRLHKPLLLHKRPHVLSNCQNLYFKDCDRSAAWGSPSLSCLWCLRTSACVLWMSKMWVCVCECVCVCFDICVCTCRSVCVLHKCVYASLCAYIRSVCSFSTHLSTLIRFTEVLWGTSVAPINGKYTRAGRKKTCYTPWSTMTASLPREAPLQSSLGL